MQNSIRNIFFFLMMVFCASCTKETEPETLSIDKNHFTFDSGQHIETVKVISNTTWNAVSHADWVRVRKSTTDKESKVSLEIENNTMQEDRETDVIISTAMLKQTIHISQDKAHGLEINQNSFSIGKEGGTFTVQVKSDLNYDVDLASDWIVQDKTRGAVQVSTLVFNVTANNSYSKRTCSFNISNKQQNLSQTITVAQDCNYILELKGESSKTFMKSGGTYTVDFTSNVSIDKVSDSNNWCKMTVTNAGKTGELYTGTVTFEAQVYNTEDVRTAQFTLRNAEKGLSKTFNIKQYGTDQNFLIKQIGTLDYNNDGGLQGLAIYGDYLFQFHSRGTDYGIFNLRTQKMESVISSIGQEFHYNCCQFSNTFYAKDDMIPLCYSFMSNTADVLVTRFFKENGTWKAEIIQQYHFGDTWLHRDFQGSLDLKNGFMYLADMKSVAPQKNGPADKFYVYKLKIPALTSNKGEIIEMDYQNALATYEYEKTPNTYGNQDRVIKNGKWYVLQSTENITGNIAVLDLNTMTTEKVYMIGDARKLKSEPEGMDFWGDKIIVTDGWGYVWQITLLEDVD